jgi:hypothetical protein
MGPVHSRLPLHGSGSPYEHYRQQQ